MDMLLNILLLYLLICLFYAILFARYPKRGTLDEEAYWRIGFPRGFLKDDRNAWPDHVEPPGDLAVHPGAAGRDGVGAGDLLL